MRFTRKDQLERLRGQRHEEFPLREEPGLDRQWSNDQPPAVIDTLTAAAE